jgi:hypothetical protein
MDIEHELHYQASPEAVYAMLAEPEFRERVCAAMDVVSADVDIRPLDDGMRVRIDMVQRTHGVPGFAKKVVGDETRVIQSETWVAGKGADLEVEIPGKPGHIRGRISLVGSAGATVERFDGAAKIGIPLIGGKLEGLIHRLFVAGMDTEHSVGTRWLAGDRG